VVVAMDETFFGDFLILVLMDLSSGYLQLEDISDDRRFETGVDLFVIYKTTHYKHITLLS